MRASVYQSETSAAASQRKAFGAVSEKPPASFLDEEVLLAALRRQDEDAYKLLCQRYTRPMLRCALLYVSDQDVAEEVVQETWLGVFQGIQRFEGKCTLRSWIFTILIHRARTRGVREKRCVPFSAVGLFAGGGDENETAGSDVSDFATSSFGPTRQKLLFCQEHVVEPEPYLLTRELLVSLQWAINHLPLRLRRIIQLRVLDGWSADEVYLKYRISEIHQRVLLYRARKRLRVLLEHYLPEHKAA